MNNKITVIQDMVISDEGLQIICVSGIKADDLAKLINYCVWVANQGCEESSTAEIRFRDKEIKEICVGL